MKLIKLQDLSTRSVTPLELVSRYIFGDNFPSKFRKKYYNMGEYTYILTESGTVEMYECIKDGDYSDLTNDGWQVANIPTTVEEILKKYDFGSIINNYGDEYNYDNINELVETRNDYSFETIHAIDLPYTGDSITLPFEYNSLYYMVNVYENGLHLIESDESGYSISGNEMTFTSSKDFNNVYITVLHKKGPASRMLVTTNIHKVINFVRDQWGQYYSLISIPNMTPEIMGYSRTVDLYLDGKYVAETLYEYSYTNNTIEILVKANIYDLFHYVSEYNHSADIQILASSSDELMIVKTDIASAKTTDDTRFELDMKYHSFKDIGSIYNCFDYGDIIPNPYTELYNNAVHIINSDYYLKTPYFTISYKNIILRPVFNDGVTLTNDLTERVYLSDSFVSNKKIPIPFINFNRDRDTLIIFKNNGLLYSSANYFIDEMNMMNFYPHVTDVLSVGDSIIFQLLSIDSSVGYYVKKMFITQMEIDNGFKIPCLDFELKWFDAIIFNQTTGRYLSSDHYKIDSERWFSFNGEMILPVGTKFEMIFLEYDELRTRTVMKRYRQMVHNKTSVELPFRYNPETDTVMMFLPSGEYIRKDQYVISSDSVVTVSGIELVPDITMDIFVFRRMDTPELTTKIPTFRYNMNEVNADTLL